MTYTLKDLKLFTDSKSVYIMTGERSPEVKLGSNRRIRAKSDELVEMYPIYICFDSEFRLENSDLIFFRVIRGQTGVKSV